MSAPHSTARRAWASKSRWLDEHAVELHAAQIDHHEAPYDLVKTMRASFLVLGPLLARTGRARVSTPGGCAIGARPVNLHITGLRALGARIQLRARLRRGPCRADLHRRANLARYALGRRDREHHDGGGAARAAHTVIENAAREPEMQDLARMLIAMGARIAGAGTHVIEIEGVERLHGAEHRVIPDRIEAGSLMVAAAITGGDVLVRNAPVEHLDAVIDQAARDRRRSSSPRAGGGWPRGRRARLAIGTLKPVELAHAAAIRGFPTDLQAQMMALLTQAAGTSVITETIFENRFMHALELLRMGADIVMKGPTAVVRGPGPAERRAGDGDRLCAPSMGLILAGLAADQHTEVSRVYHLDRGYEALDQKLQALGARIERVAE